MTDNQEIEIIPIKKGEEYDSKGIIYFQVNNIPPQVLIMRESGAEDVGNANQNFYKKLFKQIKLSNIQHIKSEEVLNKVDYHDNTFLTLSRQFQWRFRDLFQLMNCKDYRGASNTTLDFQYKDAEIKLKSKQKLILRLIRSYDGVKSNRIGDFMVFHIFQSQEAHNRIKISAKKIIKSDQIKQVQSQSFSFQQHLPIKIEMNSFKLDNKTQKGEQDSEEQLPNPIRKTKKRKNQIITSESNSPNQSPRLKSRVKSESSYELGSGEPNFQPLSDYNCYDSASNHSDNVCLLNKKGKQKNNLNRKRQNPIKEQNYQIEDSDEIMPPIKQLKMNEEKQNNQYQLNSDINFRDNNNQKNNIILIDDEEEQTDIDEIPQNNNQYTQYQQQQKNHQYQQQLFLQQAPADVSKKQNCYPEQHNSRDFNNSNPIIVDITSQEEKKEQDYIRQNKRKQSFTQNLSSNLISQEQVDSSSSSYDIIQIFPQHQQEQTNGYSVTAQQQSPPPIIQLDENRQTNRIYDVKEQIQQQEILIRSSQLKQNQNNEEDYQKDEVKKVGIYEDFIINKVGKEKDKLPKCLENNNQSKYYQEHVILDITQELSNIRTKESSEIQKGFQNSQNRRINNVMKQSRKWVNDDEIEELKEIKKPINNSQQQKENLNNLQKMKGQQMKLQNVSGIDEIIADKDYQSMQQEALNDIEKEIIVIKQEANADQPTSIKDLSNQNLQYNNYQLQNELLKARLIIQDYKIREEKYETYLIKQQQIVAALKYQNTLMKQQQGKQDNPVTVDGYDNDE